MRRSASMACFWASESSARTVIGAEGIANKAEASRGFRSFIPGGSNGIPKAAQPSFSLRRKHGRNPSGLRGCSAQGHTIVATAGWRGIITKNPVH